MYAIAKELCLKGINITSTTGGLDYDERGRLQDVSDAMGQILKGFSVD